MRWLYSALIFLVAGARLVLPCAEASVWIGAAGDLNWNNNLNWNPRSIPHDQDAVADFSAIDLMADTVVLLNSNRTVGALLFGDLVPSHNWTIGPGILTLDVRTGEPIVNVVNQTATLEAIVAGTDGLTKTGLGTLVLTQPNTYSGMTVVRSGALALDFSASDFTSNIIPIDSELRLGGLTAAATGGTIKLIGAPGASNSQTFTGTTLLFGENAISIDQNGAANVDLLLGLFDRDVGSVVNLTLPAAGRIHAQSGTIPNIHGILGAWATIGSGTAATWAANDGAGNIVPYSAFTELTGAPLIASEPSSNVRWSGSTGDASLSSGTTDINTLLFTDSARRTVTIPAGGTLRTGVSGGIFKTDATAGEEASQLKIGAGDTFLTAGGAPGFVGELILNANSNAPTQNGIIINSIISNNAAAPVSVIKRGDATVLFTASNTYSDGTYITNGRVRTTAPNGFGTGPVYIAEGAQAYLESGANSNNFFISGRGLAEPAGGQTGGALRLAGNGVTVTGKVTLLGDAQISAGGATGEGAVIAGQITGPGNVEFNSRTNGIVTLTNSGNNWSGKTTIGPGVLRIGGPGEVISRGTNVNIHGDPLSNTNSVLDLNSRTQTLFGLSSTGDLDKVFVRSSAGGSATLRIFADRFSPTDFGGIIEDGAGTVGIIIDNTGVQTLSGANTYSGPTVVDGGTLRIGSSSALPPKTSLMLTGFDATLDLAGFNATVSGLSGGGFIISSSGVMPSTLTVNGGTNVFGGAIVNYAGTAPIGLTIPSGTLTLAGANSYTGPTTLNGGTLVVNTWLEPTGTVIVNSGATLRGAPVASVAPYGRIGHVTMESGSNFRPGTAADGSIGTLTLSSLTVNGGDIRFDLGSGGASDRLNVVGTVSFNASSTITPANVMEGTYTLLTADTLRGTPPTLNVPTGARATFALSFETLADQIRLIITGAPPKSLTWTGAQSSEWDLNTTANWTDGAMVETFFNLDSVRFLDGPANRNILLNTTVVPGSVVVNNSLANEYTFSGTGSIGDSSYTGTTLTKLGVGTLTLGGTTTYNAAMTIENGLLRTLGSIAINKPVTIAEPGRLVVEGTASLEGINGKGSTQVGSETSAATLTARHIRQASLSIAAGSMVKTESDGGTSLLDSLSIAGDAMSTATFDLNNNAAIINYTGDRPVETVRAQILAGRGGPGFGTTWTGPGITSSAAAAAVATEPESRSVGYAENASLPLGPFANFRGQPVDDTSVLMAYTRTGDANLDGIVDDSDVTIVSATYAPGVPQPHWALGDFDYNGFVDDADVTLLGAFYDPSAPPLISPAPMAGAEVAAVPEPSTFGLLVTLSFVALLAVYSRRLTTADASLTTCHHGHRIL